MPPSAAVVRNPAKVGSAPPGARESVLQRLTAAVEPFTLAPTAHVQRCASVSHQAVVSSRKEPGSPPGGGAAMIGLAPSLAQSRRRGSERFVGRA
jgi:hypothetical protein